jgi:hypothetical protein
MIDKLAEEPLLKDIQQELKDQMPGFANSDVLMVGLVLNKHPDLAFAQLADQPAALTRTRMKYAREDYLKSLKDIQQRKARVAAAGEPPVPVKCPHVKPLEQIRKNLESAAIAHEASDLGILTLSMGASTLRPGDGKSGDQLLSEADTALYQAKSFGRNQLAPKAFERLSQRH